MGNYMEYATLLFKTYLIGVGLKISNHQDRLLAGKKIKLWCGAYRTCYSRTSTILSVEKVYLFTSRL